MDGHLADIARDDVVVASMLFLDGDIKSVLPALAARRDHCHAMVCMPSAGAGEELEDPLEGLNVEMAA
jgi:magnesium chelatase subunit H